MRGEWGEEMGRVGRVGREEWGGEEVGWVGEEEPWHSHAFRQMSRGQQNLEIYKVTNQLNQANWQSGFENK